MTKAMEDREATLNAKWKDEGGGYFSITGTRNLGVMTGPLAYIALPENHPAVGKPYDDFDPEVNGGLTYGSENVFGWDYLHAYNDWNIETHVRNALNYFRKISTTSATTPEPKPEASSAI